MREILYEGPDYQWSGNSDELYSLIKLLPRALELHPGKYRQTFIYTIDPEDHKKECLQWINAVRKLNNTPRSGWQNLETLPYWTIAYTGYRCLAYEDSYDLGLELADEMLKFCKSLEVIKNTDKKPNVDLGIPCDAFAGTSANLELPRRTVTFHVLKGKLYKLKGDYEKSKYHYQQYFSDHFYNNSGPATQARGLESALEVYEFDKDPEVAKRIVMFYEKIRHSYLNPDFEGQVEPLLITYMMYEVFCGKRIK